MPIKCILSSYLSRKRVLYHAFFVLAFSRTTSCSVQVVPTDSFRVLYRCINPRRTKRRYNLECNHATLAGHSCAHEVEMAVAMGVLGGLDANTGDPQVGWDTDQFLTDARETAQVLLPIVRDGGANGGSGLSPGVGRSCSWGGTLAPCPNDRAVSSYRERPETNCSNLNTV